MKVIKMIPKEGNKTDMKNFRPITPLNMNYKVIAKTYGQKINDILLSILGKQQNSFLRGRYIRNNIIEAKLTLKRVKKLEIK
jgi:hypothetical protein